MGGTVQHVTVYRDPGRYAGWPANYGIWSWGEEIVLAFTVGYPSAEGGFHTRDRGRPFHTMQARSVDGGETWAAGPLPARTPGGRGVSADEHMADGLGVGAVLGDPHTENLPQPSPGGIDFAREDFALLCARTGLRAGTRSFFYFSYDRCRTWRGPYWLPDFGRPGIAARTDYIVDGPRTCTLFLTANKGSGTEGRVFCCRTTDGGATFDFVAWIGPEPEGFAIMPASVRLPATGGGPGRILTAVRCRAGDRERGRDSSWIDLYASDDDGHTWRHVARPVAFRGTGHNGNPPTLTRLLDGRLCLTYGDRAGPYRMGARLSGDGGATWGEEIVLRDGGGNHDIGYPRTVQRPDGTVVTAYYWNERPEGERYIAATLWRP